MPGSEWPRGTGSLSDRNRKPAESTRGFRVFAFAQYAFYRDDKLHEPGLIAGCGD